MTAHAQKPDFVFRRNGRVHLNRPGASVHSTAGSRGVRISGSNAGYTMFRGSVKSTGYPLHSPVSPSLPLPYVTVCHHISTGVYVYQVSKLLQFAVSITSTIDAVSCAPWPYFSVSYDRSISSAKASSSYSAIYCFLFQCTVSSRFLKAIQ